MTSYKTSKLVSNYNVHRSTQFATSCIQYLSHEEQKRRCSVQFSSMLKVFILSVYLALFSDTVASMIPLLWYFVTAPKSGSAMVEAILLAGKRSFTCVTGKTHTEH